MEGDGGIRPIADSQDEKTLRQGYGQDWRLETGDPRHRKTLDQKTLDTSLAFVLEKMELQVSDATLLYLSISMI